MKALPAPLAPWRAWLSLFAPDLAEPLGALMLRLHPQVGPLRSAPARAEQMPEGVGSIVARGAYERLLMTEWAYADAEPDEFIRRAGSGELMFTGPEPAARQRSRRCVVLFDAGPAQLGEPRLLHLALFILLARRAEEAGAQFEWGILQEPGKLHSSSGMDGIARMLKCRSLSAAEAAALQSWRPLIDPAADDLWLVGEACAAAPLPVRARVAIRRQLLSEVLDVTITLARATHTVSLALPQAAVGTRLLRSPFKPVASRAELRLPGDGPSLQQAPRFGMYGRSLAVSQRDGGVHVYTIPSSTKVAPGKGRKHARPAEGAIIAAGVFGKSFGAILGDGERLLFRGFQSKALARNGMCERPPVEQFNASHAGRWLDCFYMRTSEPGKHLDWSEVATVIALDGDGNLGAWSSAAANRAGVAEVSSPAFRQLGKDVIGAIQFGDRLVYACRRERYTALFEWRPGFNAATEFTGVPGIGSRMLFGARLTWAVPRRAGQAALQMNARDWMVCDNGTWVTITISDDAPVLGVAASTRHAGVGLVVLTHDRQAIELRTAKACHLLVQSPEPIAQASVCSQSGDLAWVGATTLRVTVRGIDEDLPFLTLNAAEGEHGA